MKKFLRTHTISQRGDSREKFAHVTDSQNKVKDEDDRNGYYMGVCL